MSASAYALLQLTVTANGAATGERFIKHDGAPAGADDNVFGVAAYDAASGEPVALTVLGTAVVEAGAAITAGARVSSDASGRAVATDDVTYTKVLGRALDDATQAGDLVEVFLIPN